MQEIATTKHVVKDGFHMLLGDVHFSSIPNEAIQISFLTFHYQPNVV